MHWALCVLPHARRLRALTGAQVKAASPEPQGPRLQCMSSWSPRASGDRPRLLDQPHARCPLPGLTGCQGLCGSLGATLRPWWTLSSSPSSRLGWATREGVRANPDCAAQPSPEAEAPRAPHYVARRRQTCFFPSGLQHPGGAGPVTSDLQTGCLGVGASVALEAEGGSCWQGIQEGLTWASEPGCSTRNLINKRATSMAHQCIPDPCECWL